MVMLRGGMEVEVVGEANYQDVLARLCGGKTEEGAHLDCIATLVPEPSNRHDKNAIAVTIEGLKVGYLSRADAEEYQPLMRELAERGLVGQCEAFIKGGWKRADSEGHFGVVLDLEDPDHALVLEGDPMAYCGSCGAEQPAGAKFCSNCGSAIGAASAPAASPPPVAAPTVPRRGGPNFAVGPAPVKGGRACEQCGAALRPALAGCEACGRIQGQPVFQAPVGADLVTAGRLALQQRVGGLVSQGYRVQSQTPDSAQLVKPKEFSGLAALLWFLCFGIGLVIYLIYYAAKKDETVYLAVTPSGTISTQRR